MIRRALVLALLAAAVLPLAARAQTITVAPGGEMSSLVGMPFDVPIYADLTQRADKIGSFALRMTWDTTVLKLTGSGAGTFGSVTINQDSLPFGILRMTGANPAGAGGMVSLGIVHFTPLLAQPDSLRLAVSELFAAGTFADLTSSLAVHGAAFCPARGMFGDIDKDGAINSRDALIALSNAVGLDVSAFDISLGDVDANGATGARDALIILTFSVGLPTSGTRVDRIAGGSCASNLPPVMAVVPGAVDPVVGQSVAFEARAADSTGALQTVTDAIWKTSNSSVLAISPDGTAQARGAGTATVTAVRGTVDSAQATVTVLAHRRTIVVDATASLARNQLGSAAFPFGTIAQGLGFASDGDTVEVRVGRYPEPVVLSKAVVLTGDTLADGSRPVIVTDTTGDSIGVALLGPGPQEAHNLALDGFGDGVEVLGASRVHLAGLRMTHVNNGVVVLDTTQLLRIEGSLLVGRGASSSAYGVATAAPVDTLVIEGTEISDFGYDGIYAGYADSLAILGSHIHDVGENGINVSPMLPICYTCEVLPPAGLSLVSTSTAFVLDSSTVERAGYDYYLALVEYFRSASLTRSRLLNPAPDYYYGVGLFNGESARLAGDSVNTASSDWLDASNLASLVVDSTQVVGPLASAALANIPLVGISHTRLLGLKSVTAVTMSGSSGEQLTLHDVVASGDQSCSACAKAFEVSGVTTVADSLAFQNLWYGLTTFSDSGVAVARSGFQSVDYPIYWAGSSSAGVSQVKVTNTTFDGFYDAIYASGFGAVVDSNTFQGGGGTGVNFGGAYAPVWITRNRFSMVENAISGWRSGGSSSPADSVTDNVVTGSPYNGIWFQEDSVAPARLLRNTVVCSPSSGEGGSTGIELDYGDGVLADNQVSGCYLGIHTYSNGQPFAVSITGNVVTLPPSSDAGVYVYGPFSATVSGNTITSDTASSGDGIFFYNSALASGSTTISGNAVRRVGGSGIWLLNASALQLQVDSNLVDSASNGIVISSGAVSITRARIVGSRSIGILFPYSTADTADAWIRNSYIAGNRFGVQGYGYPFHAENNWWGSQYGPHYFGDQLATAGDSVSAGLLFTPFLTDTSTLVVPTAPPALALAGLRAPALRSAVMAGPVASHGRPSARQAPSLSAARLGGARLQRPDLPPRRVGPARMLAWQRLAEHRAAEASAMAQREAARAAAQAAQDAARQVRQQELQQRKADQAARLQTQREREASLRAARQAGRQ